MTEPQFRAVAIPMPKSLFLAIFLVFAGCSAEVSKPSSNYEPPVNTTRDTFTGVVGKTRDESQPAWPEIVQAPDNAPNIVIFLLDDAGYAHLQPYGSPIETPTIERLAAEGLVYTDMHSVPLCSPARAALMAGRNHHSTSMGSHIMSPAGYPGYNGTIPKSAATFAKVLQRAGYATYAFGKWDQTPTTEVSVAGPFDRWPSGQGFDRFYGFVGAEAHHFHPSLWSDHTPIAPGEDDENYFLTTDLADKAIEFIGGLRAVDTKKPFLVYWSTGAVHAPHHAPKSYIEKYAGVFDEGWDVYRERAHTLQLARGLLPAGTRLSERKAEVPAWADVPEEEKPLYARQMEAFAAQLEHTDREFGRIVDYLEKIGELDNTLIIVTSDNGASAEGGMTGLHNEAASFNSQTVSFESNQRFFDDWGGPNTVNHFHTGWGMAGNSPFPYYKHHVDGGGTHVPFIVYWPERIRESGVRTQYHHIIDVAPTILDAAGIDAPEVIDGVPQLPHDGISMAYTYDNAQAPEQRTQQYYEIWGNRAMYKDGWKAVTIHNHIMPWRPPIAANLEDDVWRLYHVDEDFSESTDLADQHPKKLKELQAAWAVEAERYGVYPVDPDRRKRFRRMMNESGRKESVIEYFPGGAIRIPEALSPPVKNKSFRVTAYMNMPASEPGSGIIATSGGVTGGYAIYLQDGYPVYVHNLYNEKHFFVRGDTPVPAGQSSLEFRFKKNEDDNGGVGSFLIDGVEVGSAQIEETTRNAFSIEDGFDIGMDQGSPVTSEYKPPFEFSGTIEKVVFDVSDQ